MCWPGLATARRRRSRGTEPGQGMKVTLTTRWPLHRFVRKHVLVRICTIGLITILLLIDSLMVLCYWYYAMCCVDKCVKSKFADGRDYRGSLSYSLDGVTCQAWTSQYPHRHTTLTGDRSIDKANGLGSHNYCRNPGGRRTKPWCYVLLANVTWQYCDVTICVKSGARARRLSTLS